MQHGRETAIGDAGSCRERGALALEKARSATGHVALELIGAIAGLLLLSFEIGAVAPLRPG